MTDCPHDIMHRVTAPSGLRYWACRCDERARLHNDSRDRAMANFVAAFDAWLASWRETATSESRGMVPVSFTTVIEARAALRDKPYVQQTWSLIMNPNLPRVCEELDVRIFSTQMLQNGAARAQLKYYVKRWRKAIKAVEADTKSAQQP